MIATALRGTGLAAAALLIIESSPFALWAVVVTSAAGLIAQLMRAWHEDRRAERQHRYDVEDREATQRARRALAEGLAENTELTRQIGDKAEKAYEAGNHISEKIALIAATALAQDRQTEKTSTASIRRDIADLAAEGRAGREE